MTSIFVYYMPKKSPDTQINYGILINKSSTPMWSNAKKTFGKLEKGDLFLIINENDAYRVILLCKKKHLVKANSYDNEKNITYVNGIAVQGDFLEEGFFEFEILETIPVPNEFDMNDILKGTCGSVLIDLSLSVHSTKLNYLRCAAPKESEISKLLSKNLEESGLFAYNFKTNPLTGNGDYSWAFVYYERIDGITYWKAQCTPRRKDKDKGLTKRDYVYAMVMTSDTGYEHVKLGRTDDPTARRNDFVGSPITLRNDSKVNIRLILPDGRIEDTWKERFVDCHIKPKKGTSENTECYYLTHPVTNEDTSVKRYIEEEVTRWDMLKLEFERDLREYKEHIKYVDMNYKPEQEELFDNK